MLILSDSALNYSVITISLTQRKYSKYSHPSKLPYVVVYVHVCIVCMYVYMYVCIHVCVCVCVCVRTYVHTYVRMYVCMYTWYAYTSFSVHGMQVGR